MHTLYRIVNFRIEAPYTIWIEFDDGVTQIVDFKSVLAGEMYTPLRDLAFFNRVRLDEESHNLVWPNDAEFEPADLHDWPEVCDEYINWATAMKLAVVS